MVVLDEVQVARRDAESLGEISLTQALSVKRLRIAPNLVVFSRFSAHIAARLLRGLPQPVFDSIYNFTHFALLSVTKPPICDLTRLTVGRSAPSCVLRGPRGRCPLLAERRRPSGNRKPSTGRCRARASSVRGRARTKVPRTHRRSAFPAQGSASSIRRRRAARLFARDERRTRCELDHRSLSIGPSRSPRRDHGSGRPKDDHQCNELRGQRLHGGLRGLERSDLGQPDQGQLNLMDAVRRTIRFECPMKDLRARPDAGDSVRETARSSPARTAFHAGRPSDPGRASRLRPVLLPQRPGTSRIGHRSVLLSSQAREPSRSSSMERRLRSRRARARTSDRHHQGDGAHRDPAGRL